MSIQAQHVYDWRWLVSFVERFRDEDQAGDEENCADDDVHPVQPFEAVTRDIAA